MTIRRTEFAEEFSDLAYEAGIEDTCAVEFTDEVRISPRSYADVDPWALHFRFAPEVLELPWTHRRGLIMHEIGHVLCRDLPDGGTEDDADRAAREAFGETIIYDERWPGKGLQCVRCGRENPASQKDVELIRQAEEVSSKASAVWDAFSEIESRDPELAAQWDFGLEEYETLMGSAVHPEDFTTTGRLKKESRRRLQSSIDIYRSIISVLNSVGYSEIGDRILFRDS